MSRRDPLTEPKRTETFEAPMEIIPMRVTMLYLLYGDYGPVLVDTGYDDQYPRFLRALRERGLRPTELAALVLTHHHDDHAGFAARLLREAPGLRVIARSEAVPRLAAGHNAVPDGSSLVNRRIAALYHLMKRLKPSWDHRFPPLQLGAEDLLLNRPIQDLSAELGLQAEAIHTPGHTADSLSLLLPGGRLLCGDLAANMLMWAGAAHCAPFNEDLAAVYRSWEKVIARGATWIYPAHGRPFPARRLTRRLRARSPQDAVPYTP